LLKNPASVIARRAKPGVAIQPLLGAGNALWRKAKRAFAH
jgi:hypothetical protein